MRSRSSTLLVSAKSLCFISWKSHVSEKYFRTSSAAFFKEVVSISMATNNKMFPTALQKYVCMQQRVIHSFSLEKAGAITTFARDYFHRQIDTHLMLEYLCLWDCFETNYSAHVRGNGKKNMAISAAVLFIDVFLIIFGHQGTSTAQRTELYQALATQAILAKNMKNIVSPILLASRAASLLAFSLHSV